jgi:hypothetical protein
VNIHHENIIPGERCWWHNPKVQHCSPTLKKLNFQPPLQHKIHVNVFFSSCFRSSEWAESEGVILNYISLTHPNDFIIYCCKSSQMCTNSMEHSSFEKPRVNHLVKKLHNTLPLDPVLIQMDLLRTLILYIFKIYLNSILYYTPRCSKGSCPVRISDEAKGHSACYAKHNLSEGMMLFKLP